MFPGCCLRLGAAAIALGWTVAAAPAEGLDPADFSFSADITFAGYSRSENLADFPALVTFGEGITHFQYGQFADADGGDLRFTVAGDTNLLPYEIDTWNPSGDSAVWVKVPLLSGAATTIRAHWGNASAVPSSYTAADVWSAGYAGVWHLGETNGLFFDSASTNHGTLLGALTDSVRGTNAIIGGGLLLSGDGGDRDHVQIAHESNFKIFSNLTVMAFSKGLDGGAWAPWVSKLGESGQGYALRRRGASTVVAEPDFVTRGTAPSEQPGPVVDYTTWRFTAGTIGEGAIKTKRVFVDGDVVAATTVSGAIADTPDSVLIGARTNSTAFWGGVIDEVRISRVERTTNWVWAVYQNAFSNDSFNVYGPVSGGPDVAVLGTNGSEIVSGDGSPSSVDGTDFGTVTYGAGAYVDRVFTITNVSGSSLELNGSPAIQLSGDGTAGFRLVSGPTQTTIVVGATATFTIRFDPVSLGTKTVTVSIVTLHS